MGKRKRSSTEWMIDTVCQAESNWSPNLPPEFVCGLRGALEAGLSCEELTALLVLFTGIYEAGEIYSGDEMIRRAEAIARVMRGDIEDTVKDRERRATNRELNRVMFNRGMRES